MQSQLALGRSCTGFVRTIPTQGRCKHVSAAEHIHRHPPAAHGCARQTGQAGSIRSRQLWSLTCRPQRPLCGASGKDDAASTDKLAISPEIVGSIAIVMGFGVANRVLYKLALTPLSDYVFFLAQFQTFSYVLLYFGILAYKIYGSKSVTKEQLEVTDKKIFLYIGAAEALSQVLGLVGASKLPGVVIPLLSQTVLLWQIGVGKVVLGRDLPAVQIGGAVLVIAGVCFASFPGNEGTGIFSEVSLIYALTYVASMFFPALSAVFKERIFKEAKEKLDGKDLDLFAVNSFGSAAQAGFVFLLLPVLCSLRGIDHMQLPQYLGEGAVSVNPPKQALPHLHWIRLHGWEGPRV